MPNVSDESRATDVFGDKQLESRVCRLVMLEKWEKHTYRGSLNFRQVNLDERSSGRPCMIVITCYLHPMPPSTRKFT